MENKKFKTKVVHSLSKSAWNVIGNKLGSKYKLARIPYIVSEFTEITDNKRREALEHANFISYCFNNYDTIYNIIQNTETK